MRLGLAFVVIAATLATPAYAETDWGKYKTFTKTRCEDKATIADIRESLKGLKFDDGGNSTFGTASKITIVSSKTVKATAGQLVCLLKMQTIEAGDTYIYSARHTVWIEPDGAWRTKYQPNY
jgi:hypothetical protein